MAGKKFSYYRRLSAAQKRIYDRSDAITSLTLPMPYRFALCMRDLRSALEADDRAGVQRACERLCVGMCEVFGVPRISVRVLSVRPHKGWGELHGLYQSESGSTPVISVWMRTAKLKHVVAFRTFLRTLVHEVMHHLDYSLLKLQDSFHTEGFYKRESSIINVLLAQEGL